MGDLVSFLRIETPAELGEVDTGLHVVMLGCLLPSCLKPSSPKSGGDRGRRVRDVSRELSNNCPPRRGQTDGISLLFSQ